MDEREFDEMFGQLLKQDFSAGTEEFRSNLLKRCLSMLDSGGVSANGENDFSELTDSDLELLAAAGEIPSPNEVVFPDGYKTSPNSPLN